MLSLVILLTIVVLLGRLARKNWETQITAGPYIMIVMSIIVSVFGTVKWADYQQRLREYDVCVGRVERSREAFIFNNTLVEIIEREIVDRPDIASELREALIMPLTLDSCPQEPTFWTGFTEGV